MSKLLFLSCHLTGTGHLVRVLALARTAQRLSHQVVVVNGGRPLQHVDAGGVEVVQLPPVHVENFDFANLLDAGGEPASDAYLAERVLQMTDVVTRVAPDALITELFPLGRRALAEEFMTAIQAARAANPEGVVLSSVRDIPEPKPKRLSETAKRLINHYDGVLVHGDQGFLPLETTWPLPDDIAPMIHHVGYVGGGGGRVGSDEAYGEGVLVSVGGGALGRSLLETAAKAAALSQRPWHLLVGGADAAAEAARLSAAYGRTNLTVEPARSDYRTLLAGAGCSISLCGYNTAVELAMTRTPAILVPLEDAGEAEQVIRAERMAEFPGITLLRTDTLSPGPLAAAADALALGPRRAVIPLKGDDGTLAVRTIEQILTTRAG